MEELLHITAESWKCLMLLAWRRRSGSSECPVGGQFYPQNLYNLQKVLLTDGRF